MKNEKKNTWVFLYIKYSKFGAFRWNISLSANLLFMKSAIELPINNESEFWVPECLTK